jgi:hypothetical protein
MQKEYVKKALRILVCILCWLTVSVAFPFLTKRWDLIRHRWVSILLTLVSPAALLTYLFILFLFDSGDYNIGPGETMFRKREEIVALTGFSELPRYTFVSAVCNDWTRVTRARYAYAEPLSDSALDYLKGVYGSCWNTVEHSDLTFMGKRCPRYHHGWISGVVEKPSPALPDNMFVSITFGREGFEVVYHPQNSFFFEGWTGKEDLKRKTGVDFPSFEAIDYELKHDGSAFLVIRLPEDPDEDFYGQLKSSPLWEENAGDFSFMKQLGSNSVWVYSFSVLKHSPIASLIYVKREQTVPSRF